MDRKHKQALTVYHHHNKHHHHAFVGVQKVICFSHSCCLIITSLLLFFVSLCPVKSELSSSSSFSSFFVSSFKNLRLRFSCHRHADLSSVWSIGAADATKPLTVFVFKSSLTERLHNRLSLFLHKKVRRARWPSQSFGHFKVWDGDRGIQSTRRFINTFYPYLCHEMCREYMDSS